MKTGQTRETGFTLMELLVVIAVLAVLATAVLTAVNPLQKIKQARDASNKSSIAQIGSALAAYYTIHQGGTTGSYYPTTLATLETSGELKKVPTQANGGAAFNYVVTPGSCDNATSYCTEAAVYAAMEAPNTACGTGSAYWAYTSSSGRGGKVCTASTPVPSDTPVND